MKEWKKTKKKKQKQKKHDDNHDHDTIFKMTKIKTRKLIILSIKRNVMT